jgi:hypothetical protein
MDELDDRQPPAQAQMKAYRKQANKLALQSFGNFCMIVGRKSKESELLKLISCTAALKVSPYLFFYGHQVISSF